MRPQPGILYVPEPLSWHADFSTQSFFASGEVRVDLAAWKVATGFAFTRASQASYFDAAGIVQMSANDNLRFDHTPLGMALGARIEPSRLNLIPTSEDFTGWTASGVNSVSADADIAPNGVMAADRIVEGDTAMANVGRRFTVAVTNGATHTTSVFVKKGALRYIHLNCVTAGGSPADHKAVYDLDTGTTSGLSAGVVAGMIALPNGWYRLWMIFVASNASCVYWILPSSSPTNSSHIGVVGAYTSLFGAMIEPGATLSSYVPTSGLAATRAADVFSRALMISTTGAPELINPANFVMSVNGGTGTATNTSGVLLLSGDGTNMATGDYEFTGLTLGETYLVLHDRSTTIGLAISLTQGGAALSGLSASVAGPGTVSPTYFVATATTMWVRFFKSIATPVTISNISVKRVVPQSEFTLVIQARTPPAGEQRTLWRQQFSTASISAHSLTIQQLVSGAIQIVSTVNGTNSIINAGTVAGETDFKLAVRFRSGDIAASLNGAAVASSAAYLPASDAEYIGTNLAGNGWGGTIKVIRRIRRGVPDNRVQALAA